MGKGSGVRAGRVVLVQVHGDDPAVCDHPPVVLRTLDELDEDHAASMGAVV